MIRTSNQLALNLFSVALCLALLKPLPVNASDGTCFKEIVPGAEWFDTNGERIQAHGGGILFKDGVYYWYGEDKTLGNFARIGISCYCSRDLVTWSNEGVVLPATELPESVRGKKGVCERPKVLYNRLTKKFVMWMHLDSSNYKEAFAGVAIADIPTGPFHFLNGFRPVKFDFGYPKDDRCNQAENGNTFRDMNLFMDDDGSAYVFYASEGNRTMYVCRLNGEFTGIQEPAVEGRTWARILINRTREAPAPFKCHGKYFLLTSACTGWSPNAASYAVADHILGPWTDKGNPCIGSEAGTTFQSQSTFILPAPGYSEGSFIYMGDRWLASHLEDSSYVWLPFVVNKNNDIVLENYPHWNLSVFGTKTFDETAIPKVEVESYRDKSDQLAAHLTWQSINGTDLYRIYRNGEYAGATKQLAFRAEKLDSSRRYTFQVQAVTLFGKKSPKSEEFLFDTGPAAHTYLSDWVPDAAEQSYGALAFNQSVGMGPIQIGNNKYQKGLGTHANSHILYQLHGQYTRFSSRVGIDGVNRGSVAFSVVCDGERVFESTNLTFQSPPLQVNLDITGVKKLELIVTGSGKGINGDHADWADAFIE